MLIFIFFFLQTIINFFLSIELFLKYSERLFYETFKSSSFSVIEHAELEAEFFKAELLRAHAYFRSIEAEK